MGFLTQDYRKRFQAALALLMEIYVADVLANIPPHGQSIPQASKVVKTDKDAADAIGGWRKGSGFALYDKTLLSLLTELSRSLEASWHQKLFTQTLLECPRIPPPALELVCTLCNVAASPHDVQTGKMLSLQHTLLAPNLAHVIRHLSAA